MHTIPLLRVIWIDDAKKDKQNWGASFIQYRQPVQSL